MYGLVRQLLHLRPLEEVVLVSAAPAGEEPVLEQVDSPALWRTPRAPGLVPVQLALVVLGGRGELIRA